MGYKLNQTLTLCCTRRQGSFGAFAAFDLEKAFPTSCRVFPERHVRGKRHRERPHAEPSDPKQRQDGSQLALCLRYTSMLCLDYVEPNELLVVEQPWLSCVANFGESLHRKVYGS